MTTQAAEQKLSKPAAKTGQVWPLPGATLCTSAPNVLLPGGLLGATNMVTARKDCMLLSLPKVTVYFHPL